MALIKCSKCGKEISENSPSCIYCGNPNDMIIKGIKARNSFIKGIIGAYKVYISIMLSIFGLVFLLTRFYLGFVIIGIILFSTFRKLNKGQTMLKK